MATKLTKASKEVRKIFHPNIIKAIIPSGGASVGPPLGTNLAQYGLTVAKFVEEFNNQTKDHIPGIPTPVRIHIDGKRFRIELCEPRTSYLILQAAGVSKGAKTTGKICGKITHKHVYEIAKVKIQQENIKIRSITMKEMCELIANQAWKMGIKVQRTLDADEYKIFLDEQEKMRLQIKAEKERAMAEAAEKLKKKNKKLAAN